MESSKLEFKTFMLCFAFFFSCFTICNAQKIFNCNDNAFKSNLELKSKIDTILNSSDLIQFGYDQKFKKSEKSNIIDIRYENLKHIKDLNSLEKSTLKYCIIRLKKYNAPIDLQVINALINLELIHIIIETDYSDTFSFLNIKNPNLLITYLISVPQ